jgi:uridylate kinase
MHFKTEFINLTNVPGLHDKNPFEHKDARFIPEITWKEFYKMATKKRFSPGQHFVLDQTAAGIIMKHKITTYILGKNLKELEFLLKGKKFKGTIITD